MRVCKHTHTHTHTQPCVHAWLGPGSRFLAVFAEIVTELCPEDPQKLAKIVLNLVLFMSPIAHAAYLTNDQFTVSVPRLD